jgi:glucosamine--fructose-6-phosphate aminotransferase (isomerizing)
MCGIVGYTGPREAAPILLEGLARLEYRGYDSAGIALVTSGGDLFVEKRAGKLANLRTALLDATPSAAVGLAHTRWATHGRPNDLNAHPHNDCTGEITVIHNGIIENFRELRDGLAARGHTLASETDTEALAHLVEEAYQGDIADAVRDALSKAHGAYAVAVLHKREPGRLVGARENVPLIVGLGEGENFLASDVAAVLAHTPRVIFLEEGDVADITPSSVTITGRRRPAARARPARDRVVDRGRREGWVRPLHAQGDARAVAGGARRDHRPRAPPDHRPRGARADRGSTRNGRARRVRRVRQRELRGDDRRAPAPAVGRAAGALQHRLRVPLQPAAAR